MSQTIYTSVFKHIESQEIVNLEQRDAKIRQQLMQLIQKRANEDGVDVPEYIPNLSKTQLESYIEYGTPYAFPEQQYSDQRSIIELRNGSITDGTSIMRSKKQIDRDNIHLAYKLSGRDAMYRVRNVLKPKNVPLESRKDKIKRVLDKLPSEYNFAKQEILELHLTKLAQFCLPYYMPTIQRIVANLVFRLVRLRGYKYGIYVHLSDIAEVFAIPQSGILEHETNLIEAGFFKKEEIYDFNFDEIISVSLDKLFMVKEMLGSKLPLAQTLVQSLPSQLESLSRARTSAPLVLAVISAHLANPKNSILQYSRLICRFEDTPDRSASLLTRNARNTLRRSQKVLELLEQKLSSECQISQETLTIVDENTIKEVYEQYNPETELKDNGIETTFSNIEDNILDPNPTSSFASRLVKHIVLTSIGQIVLAKKYTKTMVEMDYQSNYHLKRSGHSQETNEPIRLATVCPKFDEEQIPDNYILATLPTKILAESKGPPSKRVKTAKQYLLNNLEQHTPSRVPLDKRKRSTLTIRGLVHLKSKINAKSIGDVDNISHSTYIKRDLVFAAG